MKITVTNANATLLSLVSGWDKTIIEWILIQKSVNSIASVLIQNKSANIMYVELWKAADADSVSIASGASLTLNKVNLASINIISNNASSVWSILVFNS